MIELLLAAAARDPSAAAVIHASTSLTYGELLTSAKSVAAALEQRDIKRFAVVDPDPTVVLALLAGASLAGAEACLYPPTGKADVVSEFAERFDHDVVVTDVSELSGGFAALSPRELTVGTGEFSGDLPAARPHLVLTTGTTGVPRAVRHDWSRLLRVADGAQSATGQRWLLAYGMNQFGGLQVLIHTMAVGATLVTMETFVPRAGLEAIRSHAVTHVSATPTFWRFLLAELRSAGGSAPSLEQITLGGEAVPAQVLSDLEAAFPGVRITQIYAANEFGKALSVRDTANGLPLSALTAQGGVELQVRDGELWVRSSAGMLGYYGEDPVDPDGWRATGDLVEIQDDRVFFRGRVSDVINVGGVKVPPLPVEDRINKLPGVQLVRVYGRPNALTGAIVAVEVLAEPGADTDELDSAIRRACEDLPPASRPRSIRFVDEVATVQNKITRQNRAQEATSG